MIKGIINYGFTAFLIVFPVVVLPWRQSFENDILVSIGFIIIGLISMLLLIRECRRYSYSLMMMHWFFIYVFLFCAGVTQFANNSYMWGLSAPVNTIIYANILIIMWELIACSISCFKIKKNNTIMRLKTEIEYKISNKNLIRIEIVLIVIGLYPIFTNGVVAYFSRELFGKSIITSLIINRSIKMVLDSIIIGFCLWTAIMTLKKSRFGTISRLSSCLAVIALLLNVTPLGLPRFEIAAVYGGILLYNSFLLKKKNIFIIFMFLGLFFVFPMLNSFRYLNGSEFGFNNLIAYLGTISSNFLRADYDAYSMILYTVEYVSYYGYSYGYQLLGVLLFYVPSSVWLNKPVGSGSMIIDNMTIGIDGNVSCPLIAEGLINFGITGVILFSILFVTLLTSIDRKYWKNNNNNPNLDMFYCCSVPFIVFIMRGDMMSTMSFYFGFFASLLLYVRLFMKKCKKINGNECPLNQNDLEV